MSLKITLTTPLVVIKQPEITETITEVDIERIVDMPAQKKVFVFIGDQRIELSQLSDDNYDTPEEWSNETLIDAVKAHYGIV
jgi:hypothetical protein